VTAYAAAYRDVLESCRAAAAAASGAERDFYESLEGLARPWMTLDVLVHTDAEMLADLLRRCRDAERRLLGQGPRPPSRRALSAGTAALIALLLVMAAGIFALDWWPASLTRRLRALADDAWYSWRLAGQTTQLLILGAVVALFLLALVGRWARK
jgi:hypothetical protein